MLHGKTLHIDTQAPSEMAVAVLKALASGPRWRILQYLAGGGRSINEVADALELPPSTAAAHIKVLEEAGLIFSELQAATHGLQKICTRTYDNVSIQLPYAPPTSSNSVEVAMPIGAYTTFEVQPTCGLASSGGLIGYLDDPLSFYEPERIHAGLLWFRSGFVEYVFPNRLPPSAKLLSLQFSVEICSEAPLYNPQWPSDITVWINGREIGTWTCPADFGGQRGALTPGWWDEKDTQYGLLKRWLVNLDNSCIDGRPLSRVTIGELGIEQERVITVRLGVKHDALHVGGI
ncbi:MAG: helix-turn-helix domain-containing protein, partial [Chloroflexi bacterium]|nr:helix-turn-helix domain-containing protein [Chloroflexota bacterium]